MKRPSTQPLVAALFAVLAAHGFGAAGETDGPPNRSAHAPRVEAGAAAPLGPTASLQKRTARRRAARRASSPRRPANAKQQPAPTGTATEKGETPAPREQLVTGDSSTIGMTPEQAMGVAIREALRKPREGETRARGVLTLIECGPRNAAIFHVRAGAETLKLNGGDLRGISFTAFTPREAGSEVGCGPRKLDTPVVVTYRPTAEGGDLVAVEFVPASFTLEK
jgi:hypothetical protein